MTSVQISSIAGVVLSLVLAYLPGVSAWFSALESVQKVSWTGLLLVLVAAVPFALKCSGFDLGFALTCDVAGAKELISNLVAALVANQGTYSLLVKPFKN